MDTKYTRYGEKWERELSKNPKADIAAMFRNVAKERDALQAEREALKSNLRFYDGLVCGDGEHNKIALAKNAAVFVRCFSLLGMDVSGTDIHEIPDAIERLKAAAAAREGA